MLAELTSNRKPQEYGKVAVLLGGNSAEREVSLKSGDAVFNALIKSGIDAVRIDPKNGLYNDLIKNNVDRVFVVLHGRGGEDGVVQGFLKTLEFPFTGSDVSSAAIAMNKLYCKQIWREIGIATAEFVVVSTGNTFTAEAAEKILNKLGDTVFVKPVKEGSSVGMSKVTSIDEFMQAIKLAHQYDHNALVESYISGKEYTVSIIKGKALPSIRMQTPRSFYDYQAKYQSDTTEYFCPSGLTDDEENSLAEIALQAFFCIGCSGWGRVDFIREGDKGDFLILEVNTVPGMTATSLVPKAAKSIGIDFENLVLQILDSSFCDSENKIMESCNV